MYFTCVSHVFHVCCTSLPRVPPVVVHGLKFWAVQNFLPRPTPFQIFSASCHVYKSTVARLKLDINANNIVCFMGDHFLTGFGRDQVVKRCVTGPVTQRCWDICRKNDNQGDILWLFYMLQWDCITDCREEKNVSYFLFYSLAQLSDFTKLLHQSMMPNSSTVKSYGIRLRITLSQMFKISISLTCIQKITY